MVKGMSLKKVLILVSIIVVILCFILILGNYKQNSKKPEFNVRHGFYEEKFRVKIFSKQKNAFIGYTLDGSDPLKSKTVRILKSPVVVMIDPDSNPAGVLPAVILRAYARGRGCVPSVSVTQTYIFINRIVEMSPDAKRPGKSWPRKNLYIDMRQFIDYGMDPEIFDSKEYGDNMGKAFMQIPTISLVTENKNLFDKGYGIYVNANKHGRMWERPVSFEIIDRNNKKALSVNAGLRIRGGWSRHNEFPKHAFRLFFRKTYGPGKLKYRLFGVDGTKTFNKIDIRTSQNYSWANRDEEGSLATFVKDVFSRDLQNDMGNPYTRSKFYHLFLNGCYWGLYQTQERPEASYAASYFGGKKEDYDIIKVDIGPYWNLYEIEATDGNLEAWKKIWNLSKKGFKSDKSYYHLEGKDENGKRDFSREVFVDIDNLIDYMIIIFYTGNFDSPVTKFSDDHSPNNFYAIYNRNNKNKGFIFLIHDAEHILLADPVEVGDGIEEDRVNLSRRIGEFRYFNPYDIHTALMKNAKYCKRFDKRVKSLFFNKGALTPEENIKRFIRWVKEIDFAVIAESARWGDAASSNPYTKKDWEDAVSEVLKEYFPFRGEIVLSQLEEAGLYFPEGK